MASKTQFDLRFGPSNLDYPGIHVHVASNSHFDYLWGHGGRQTAWEVTYDLGIELSDLNYLSIHVHIASNSHFGDLWGQCGPQMTSEVTSDLRIELSDLDYLCSHISLASKGIYGLNDMEETKYTQYGYKWDAVSLNFSANLSRSVP